MADETVTIRVSKDIQERFHQLAAESSEFKNKGEFFGHLLAQYQLEQVKSEVPLLEPAISAITELNNRISRVLIGAGEQIICLEQKQQERLAQTLSSAEQTRAVLQGKIEEQDAAIRRLQSQNHELQSQYDTVVHADEELKKQIAQAERANHDKLMLVDEYIEKNKRLLSALAEQQSEVQDAQKLAEQNRTLKFQLNTMQQQLEQQAKQMEFDKQQELLELRQGLNEKMEMRQNIYNAKLNDYENKVKDLLFQLEQRPVAGKIRPAKAKPNAADEK